jgi:hypothetical protein
VRPVVAPMTRKQQRAIRGDPDESASRPSAAHDRDAVCAGQQRQARMWAIGRAEDSRPSWAPAVQSEGAGAGRSIVKALVRRRLAGTRFSSRLFRKGRLALERERVGVIAGRRISGFGGFGSRRLSGGDREVVLPELEEVVGGCDQSPLGPAGP